MTVVARIFFLLIVGISTVTVGVISVMRLTYRDLFAPYQALMPGNSIDILRDYPCHFRSVDVASVSCAFNIGATFFGRVTVSVSNRVITKTNFLIRSGDVHLGDLVLCWGKPSGTILNAPPHSTSSVDIFWGEYRYTTIPLGQGGAELDDFTPVTTLSIGDHPPACGSREYPQ